MGYFVPDDKNCMGCFVRDGKLMWDVLSMVSKMAWDVLSWDNLSYIHGKVVRDQFPEWAAARKGDCLGEFAYSVL